MSSMVGPRIEASAAPVAASEVRVTLNWKKKKELNADAAEWRPPIIEAPVEEEKPELQPRVIAAKMAFVTGNPALGEDALRFGVARLTSAPDFLPLLDDWEELKKDTSDFAPDVWGGAPLPEGEATSSLAFIGVPSRFVASDLLEILAPWRSAIKHIRVARHCEPPSWPAKLAIVFLNLKSTAAAVDLYQRLHGRAFNSFEPDRCNFAFVDSLQSQDNEKEDEDFWYQTGKETTTESAPVCVVCLEKLTNDDESQLYTTACDHTFHTDCLRRWRDAPCPVCRYDHAGAHGSNLAEICDECASSRDLWVCLLCGHCGCEQEHAREHFEATKHAYAINVDHRHVWDFVGEGYVHRLVALDSLTAASGTTTTTMPIQEEDDGNDDIEAKSDDEDEIRAIRDVLVDEGDVLGSRTRRRRPGPPSFARGDDPKKVLYYDDDDNEDDRAYDHRKLEGLAVEYNELLRSQLAKQREIYEDRIRDAREAAQEAPKKEDAQRIAAIRRRKKLVDAKRAKLRAKIDDLENDIRFEDDLFQTIQADLVEWKDQLTKAQSELRDVEHRRETLIPLFEKRAADRMRQLDEIPDVPADAVTHEPELRILGLAPAEESKAVPPAEAVPEGQPKPKPKKKPRRGPGKKGHRGKTTSASEPSVPPSVATAVVPGGGDDDLFGTSELKHGDDS